MAEAVHHLTLAQAAKIADEVLAQARQMQLNPMAVAVLDAGGQLVVYKREDDSPLLRFAVDSSSDIAKFVKVREPEFRFRTEARREAPGVGFHIGRIRQTGCPGACPFILPRD